MKFARIIIWSLFTVAILLAVAAGALHWATRSETALNWAVDRIARELPCRLTVEGMRGALLEPVRAARVICENAKYRIEARDLSFDWTPTQLIRRRLDISLLQAEILSIVDKEKDVRPSLPADLVLPMPVRVSALEIGKLTIESGGEPVALSQIRLEYRGDASSHRVDLRSLVSEWGTLQGEATLGAAAPFALSARIAIRSEAFPAWPVALTTMFSGSVKQTNVLLSGMIGSFPLDAELDISPFDPDPLQRLIARTDKLDISDFDKRLPHTALSAEVMGSARGLDSLFGTLRIVNADGGRLDRDRLPLREMVAQFDATLRAVDLSDVKLDLGTAGEANGSAHVERGLSRLQLEVRNLDLGAIHNTLRKTRLAGAVSIGLQDNRQRISADVRQGDMRFQGEGVIADGNLKLDRLWVESGGAKLQASGRVALGERLEFELQSQFTRFDPSMFGEFPRARINGVVNAKGRLRPDWLAEVNYDIGRSSYRGERLDGKGTLVLSHRRFANADAGLVLGGNSLRVRGSFGKAGDKFDFDIDAPGLSTIDRRVSGHLRGSGTLSGTPAMPSIAATLQGEDLEYENYRVGRWSALLQIEQDETAKSKVQIRLARAAREELTLETVELDATGTLAAQEIEVKATGPDVNLSARLQGGWEKTRNRWSGEIAGLDNSGKYAFRLTQPARLEAGENHLLIGATALRVADTDVTLDQTRYSDGHLSAAGSMTGMPLSVLLALAGKSPEVESSLTLGGRWTIRAQDTVEGFVELARERGDVVIAAEQPVPLGLTDLRLEARARSNQIALQMAVIGDGLRANAELSTQLERRKGRWGISGDAPLRLGARVDWQSIAALVAVVSPSVTADGSVSLSVQGDGTVDNPRLRGQIEANALKFEQVESGVFLRRGQLRATFDDRAIAVSNLSISGGAGTFSANGRITTGRDAIALDLNWAAQKLVAVQHPDLQLTVSGSGKLIADESRIALSGKMTADQGRVELRAGTAPSLGDDVVVAGREERKPAISSALRPELDLRLDLGPDFLIRGRGLDARLHGAVTLASRGDAPIAANGEIRVERGTYEAYGQRLVVEKGVFYFSGPVENPGLEILALRKNLQVEAGVEVTGTARDPRVRLVSIPDVPDPEKISWLVLGRRVESGETGDAAALQASAVALAAGLGTMPLQKQLARAVGVDELRVAPSNDGSQGGIVTAGKHLSDRVYVSYEQSLSAATNTLRISYQLSRRWSLRTESGETDAVDLFFTLFFD